MLFSVDSFEPISLVLVVDSLVEHVEVVASDGEILILFGLLAYDVNGSVVGDGVVREVEVVLGIVVEVGGGVVLLFLDETDCLAVVLAGLAVVVGLAEAEGDAGGMVFLIFLLSIFLLALPFWEIAVVTIIADKRRIGSLKACAILGARESGWEKEE